MWGLHHLAKLWTNDTSRLPPLEIDGSVWSPKDYTFYLHVDDREAASITARLKQMGDLTKYSGEVVVKADGGRSVTGRGLVCRCFKGEYYSISLRSHKDADNPDAYSFGPDKAGEATENFLIKIDRLCDELYPVVFSPSSRPHGLIVVSGETGSAKSQVAFGLCVQYLKQLRQSGSLLRRPHFVTFEDPIETKFAEDAKNAPQLGVDYTPREANFDSRSIAEALEDALRQKPSVFYVGEVRKDRDWREIMNFAGTGHLIVTTTHAGSLVETMGRILRAVKADTPSRRRHFAQRILAAVHQITLSEEVPGGAAGSPRQTAKATIPAVWRRTTAGLAALVADGLDSIVPNNRISQTNTVPPGGSAGRTATALSLSDDVGSIGRYTFARRLLQNDSCDQQVLSRMYEHALKLDLEGI